MSDFHDPLDLEARRINAGPDVLTEVRRRAARRRRTQRLTSAVLALAIGGAGIGLSYAAFNGTGSGRPSAGPSSTPTPGPTPTSDGGTPAPIPISIENRAGDPDVQPYVISWIEALGRGAHHGGYDLGDVSPSSDGAGVAPVLAGEPVPLTTIYFNPGYEREAVRVERLLFPGAAIAPWASRDVTGGAAHPDLQSALHVVLGTDFAERHAAALKAFAFVGEFGFARVVGSPNTDRFVTEEVARAYEEGRQDLSMYDYSRGGTYRVWVTSERGIPRDGESGVEFQLTFRDMESDFYSELLRVVESRGQLKIVEASLVFIGMN